MGASCVYREGFLQTRCGQIREKSGSLGATVVRAPHMKYTTLLITSESDVGGGSSGGTKEMKAAHKEGFRMSNPSLLWMVQQINQADVKIIWTKPAFRLSKSVSMFLEAAEEPSEKSVPSPQRSKSLPQSVHGALTTEVKLPLRDSLARPSSCWWWIVEILPVTKHYLTSAGERWKRSSYVLIPSVVYFVTFYSCRINRGRGRRIHTVNPLFHESVRTRMEANLKPNYRPRAKWEGTPEYVLE